MRTCRHCLLYEGMTFFLRPHPLPDHLVDNFYVAADGTCCVCQAYRELYDPGVLQEEVEQLYFECDGLGEPALVALSGGKDSLSTLYLVRRKLGLRAEAALFDNGYIPESVLARCRHACATLDVPLHVIPATPDQRAEMDRLVQGAAPGHPTPCSRCSQDMVARFLEVADQVGSGWLVSGTNYFTPWRSRPSSTLALRTPGGRALTFINLPYAMKVTHPEVLANLDSLGVGPPPALPGVSSNCRVPGLVQDRVAAPVGHVPELEDLALEVLVGHRTRESAWAELRRKAPAFAARVDELAAGTV